ncbi:MAG TPA: type II toxin-antitoxin system Phd/YefM family antitoxin [Planctomycetota bacterium]|nr:type II toxin-antitoxin system Phd/YefM family antitoxin [Planctomycetota bacterium]
MATEVSVHEAKTHLSRLLRRVAAGEQVIIARAGKPVAILTAFGRPRRRKLGVDEGKFVVPKDFNAPLPEDVLGDFER